MLFMETIKIEWSEDTTYENIRSVCISSAESMQFFPINVPNIFTQEMILKMPFTKWYPFGLGPRGNNAVGDIWIG